MDLENAGGNSVTADTKAIQNMICNRMAEFMQPASMVVCKDILVEYFRWNPLHQKKAKQAEGPFEPKITRPVRQNRIIRSQRDLQSQNLDVNDIQQALFEDVETLDASEMKTSPWLDNAILIQNDKWFASYNTLREVSEAIDRLQDAPTRRRLRASPPPEAGAGALATPAESFVSIPEALHEFPTAAKRLAEYEQRVTK